jgi:hypothetical protein
VRCEVAFTLAPKTPPLATHQDTPDLQLPDDRGPPHTL